MWSTYNRDINYNFNGIVFLKPKFICGTFRDESERPETASSLYYILYIEVSKKSYRSKIFIYFYTCSVYKEDFMGLGTIINEIIEYQRCYSTFYS